MKTFYEIAARLSAALGILAMMAGLLLAPAAAQAAVDKGGLNEMAAAKLCLVGEEKDQICPGGSKTAHPPCSDKKDQNCKAIPGLNAVCGCAFATLKFSNGEVYQCLGECVGAQIPPQPPQPPAEEA